MTSVSYLITLSGVYLIQHIPSGGKQLSFNNHFHLPGKHFAGNIFNNMQSNPRKATHSNVFKQKRNRENDYEDSSLNEYKRRRLIEDFSNLDISSTEKIRPSQKFIIQISNFDDAQTEKGAQLLQNMKNDYLVAKVLHDWQLTFYINWSIFLYFLFVNRFRSLYTKIKNILYWKQTRGTIQGLPIWEYYYNDCYESSKKYHYLSDIDVEMEM
ncbi:hypothetical protein QEN19_001945 [Hanseniaspora menglaensis]